MSGKRSKKNQRPGSSRRGPEVLNSNIEKDDEQFQQIAESEDGRNEFHTSTEYHSTQFDHPPSSSTDQQTSALECPPHARGHKDSLMENKLPEQKRKMGSTRKRIGRIKDERKLDEIKRTGEFDEEYVTQPNTSTTEEQHASLTEEEQSRSMSFPSDLNLQTKSSELRKEPGTTLMLGVLENEEKDTIHYQEITFNSHEVLRDIPIDEKMVPSVHSIAVTVAESDLLQKDSVMFDEPSCQDIPIASTSRQKRRICSTRRPLGEKNRENVGVQEHSSNIRENKSKAEVLGEAKFPMSEEMEQTWDGVARDVSLSHTESALVLNQSLLAERAELKEPDVSAGTETMNKSVTFPLVDSEKPLPETSSQHGTPSLNEGFDFNFGSHTGDFVNKVWKEAESDLSDNSQCVLNTSKDTNTSYNFTDVNTEAKEKVLKQKEELSINYQMSDLLPKQDAQLEELELNYQEYSLSQHDIATLDNNCGCSMAQLKVGGSRSFNVPVTNISHAEPTATNLPHEMSDAFDEKQEIQVEIKQESNVCDFTLVTCDTLTDLECIMEENEDPQILAASENENTSNQRGSETDNALKITDQHDVRDHNVIQTIMDVRDNEKDAETSTETIWISHQKPCEVPAEKEELNREQEQYSSNISRTQSPLQDAAGKMLETDEVRKGRKDTENAASNDVTTKSEEMFSFKLSATVRGSHAHQQLFMQYPDKEGYDSHENVNEKSEEEGILVSVESENASFDRGDGKSEGTKVDAEPVVMSNVEAVYNDSESANPEQNRELALKVSTNAEKEVSGERDTIVMQSDINLIPEEAHSKSSPVIYKRKMGSTRRPLRGKKGQKIEMEHHDENETLECEGMINLEKKTFSLEDESITNASLLRTTKDGVKVQDMELCEDNDVGPVERSESALLQSSCRSDFLSEESTAVSICHVTESQTLMKLNEESQENAGDAEKVAAEENKDLQLETESQNKISDTTTYDAEGTEEKINDVSVTLVREVEVTGDTGTVESNMTTESDLIQNDTSSDPKLEAIKVSDDAGCKVQEETVPKQSDTTIIPHDTQKEEAHSEFTVIHKRKMGSTRRPHRGKNGQRKEKEHRDENETPYSEDIINVEKETISLEDESITNASLLRTTKDGVKEQDMELCEDNDVGPVERSESALLQSSCRSDFLSEESTAVSICHITESQTLMKLNKESQENAGDAEKVAAEENKDLQLETESQNKISDTTSYEAEGTEEKINDVSVTLIREVEVTGDTGTVESNMTMESDLMQNDTSSDAKLEAIKVSDNTECEVQEETDTVPKQSDTTIIPQDTQKEEAHSEFTVIHKRKMGSTRRPLRGKNRQRKEKEHHDENETPDSEDMINVEKETISLEDESITNASLLRTTKDGVKVQDVELCEDNDVGPVERSESALLQSSCRSDFLSEESTAVSICHVTESQTLMKLNKESQENAGDAEKVAAEENKDLQLETESQNKISDTTTYEAEGTEENINDVSVTLVREVEVTGDTGTVESNLTTESDFLHTSPDVHIEALKISENVEKDVSGETDTVLKQSDINLIPEDSHTEEAHSKSSPVIQKRKMGSTRRPLRGNEGQRQEHDEKEIFMLKDEPSPDESRYTAVSVCDISESQTLPKIHAGSQENSGDVEIVPAEEDTERHLENQTFDSTAFGGEATEENICEANVLDKEVEFIGDTVTLESNITTESDLIQNDTSSDPKLEAIKVSDDAECKVQEETVPKQSDTTIIPHDNQKEEAHSEFTVIHKRKMGSTRRPLRGKNTQRKEKDHHDENETPDSEDMINVEKETISLEDESITNASLLRTTKDGVKVQDMELCEDNDVGPVERSESALLQSSCRSDFLYEESTAVSICHVTESQTLMKLNKESQENAGDAEKVAAEENKDLQLETESQNKIPDTTSYEAEGTEEKINDVSVTLVGEVEVTGDTGTVESNMTMESDLMQNDTSSDAKLEAIKVYDNTECEVQEETDTVPKQSDTTIIPQDAQKEEAHSEFTVIHKRKMGSTRRPLRGKNGQRKEKEHHDENETLDSEDMINVEEETISLEDEPPLDESTLQSVKLGAKEQEMDTCKKNDVGPVERSKSTDMQSSCSSDLTSEESIAINICHITESQTPMKLNEESQENVGDADKGAAEDGKDLQLEIESRDTISDTTTYEAEGTDEKINDVRLTLVREVEVTGDTGTVESNMTMESDLMQNDTSSDAKLEAIKVYDNTECEVQEETDTVPKQSDTTIIPQDAQKEEAHSEFTVIHKRKMGSTRRPLRGKNGQRKEKEHHDENETLDSEDMINVEEETISLEDEPPLDESTLQSVKLGAKEQEMDTCKKNDVGPVERSKSTDMQSSCSSDLTSEESIAINICHITESQTPMKLNEESQENVGDADKGAAEEGKDLQLEIESRDTISDTTTYEAEGTDEKINDVRLTLVREVEVTGDTGTVESNLTTESDFLHTSPDVHIEALKISENVEKDVSGETDTVLKQSDINLIPEDSHTEEAHSKSSPVIQKRKMGSTRRPLRGNKGQRQEHDEKEIFILKDEPSPDESRYTAVSVCDISESQTLPKIHAGSQENSGDVEIVPAEEDTERHLENQTFDSTAFGGEATEENICEAIVLDKEVEFIGDTVTLESNITTESGLIQNDTSSDAKLEAFKVSDNAEREVQKETDTVPKQSDTTIIPQDAQKEEAHSEFTVIHKRKMGSTRRPLRGKNRQRKEKEHHDENETLDSEDMINVEEETISLEDEPPLDESTLQSVKLGAKEQEMDTCKKNDVGPVERSKSTDLQSSCSSDLTSEESIAINICHITESQTLMKLNEESQENAGDAENVAAEENKDLQLETESQDTISDTTTYEAEGTEEKINDVSVTLVGEVEVTGDTGTGEINMTTESDLIQNDTSSDAKLEAIKVSEHAECEVKEETDTFPKQSDTTIIPQDTQKEEAHSEFTVIHKRKMGSTRRPLRGKNGQRKVRVESEEDTKAHLEVQYQDNVVDHIETQEFLNIRDNKDEDRKTTETVDMSVQEPCDDLELKQRSDVSQTQSGPSQDDTGSHLFEVPERTADFVRDRFACRSHSALILSDALLMEETQMYVSSENAAPTEMAEMHPFSKRSMKKRKMGSTRKRGKRMVNDEEVEEEKEGEAENTTNDDGTTKSEENLTIEEAIAGSPEPQQLFISSADREGHEIQDIVSKSDVQTDISEQNYPNSSINPNLLIESECSSNVAAEMISDFSLGYADTYLGPKQIVIVKQSVIPKESHREDQSSLNPVFQKRKMGSTRKTLRGNKGQGKEESKKMDRDSKEMTQEQDTEPHLATSARKTECKFDEKVEQNFPVDFSHPVASSKMCPESENGGKEVSPNIHDLSEVSEEKGMESTGNDSNSENEAINLYDRTKDKFVLKVNNKDVDQTVSVDVYVGSEPEQTENTGHVFPTQELKSTQDDFVNEISSTQEKRRKMGSTRRNPKVIHGENMADNADALGVAENSETKKAEDDLDDMPLASSINQSKEVSSVSTTDLESEMLGSATDLKEENDHQNNSEPSGPTVPETPENTLQLVNADVTKHPQSETVTTEKRRKMGSTRKNLRAGRNQGIREGFEETETTDTNLQMPQDSEMSLGDQTSYDYSDQSEDSLLSEIERALNKTSQSSMSNDGESIIKEPKHIANAPDLNMQENSEIKSLQPTPLVHSEPNSPGGRRRKMGSTRKNSRQQLKAEREDEDKEDGEKDISNLRMDEQEIKDLERVEVSIVPNITENKLNKEYLDVSSAHTSSSQLEESANPVCQERTSPSTKRKFGSRRANKSKQGLSSLATSDFKNELEDGDHKADKLCSDVSEVCDPCLTLQPENQPITHPVSEQRNMEAKNEEAAPKATGAGPVSLGQIIKPDRSTGAKQTVNLNNSISDAEEVQFNVVMVGNCSVGKTSFIRRFHEGQFTEDYRSTIGVDTCIQTVALPDRTVKLQIWDTAGQERFHSITTQVFHRADGLLLMYAITCSNSFISVRDWISRAQERAPDDVIMMLLGNKNDSGERAVQIQEGADLAREYNINFMECSAATGANVSESMTTLAELLMERKSQKERHATLRREPSQKKSGCC
ncbi:uncharacterized protein LOC128015794 isoform X19 [Carassius gibelio]|uniref:uncharacterized protein LOC128015794 isoform X19 n=1 Tax=Carassius gibelio TaxID=101364 RepID=UPI002277B3E4|nr:uncharacterized protein LOC128015794 isoform X19 [Carassius gibelio]